MSYTIPNSDALAAAVAEFWIKYCQSVMDVENAKVRDGVDGSRSELYTLQEIANDADGMYDFLTDELYPAVMDEITKQL